MYHITDYTQFYGVVSRASNIGHGFEEYTVDMFREDFPQFFDAGLESFAPETITEMTVRRASESIQPDKWLQDWRYACGLYAAHYLTLYLRNYNPSPHSAAEAAATGSVSGVVKRATLGDSSVEYDTSAVTQATTEWGDLNATSYGQQLATMARLVGMGGMAVI